MPELHQGSDPRCDPARIVVVGGGVGGLAAAIRLRRSATTSPSSSAATSSAASSPRTNATATPSTSARRWSRCRTSSTRCSGPRVPRSTNRSTWSASIRSSRTTGRTARRWWSPTATTRPHERSTPSRRERAGSGARSTPEAAASGTSPSGRSSPGRCRIRGRSRSGCGRRSTSPRSTRCERCTARPSRSSTTPASSSGPVATPRTPVRRRTRHRPRSPASRTSRLGFGCWYPMGGLDALRAALERVARDTGVEIHTGAEVARILAPGGRRRVRCRAGRLGTLHHADIVVANTDAEHLYADLLPDACRAASGCVGRSDRRVGSSCASACAG